MQAKEVLADIDFLFVFSNAAPKIYETRLIPLRQQSIPNI